ncbi:MAG: hypothetical protein PVG78_11255 [Desulfobacterales bacterium]
MRIAYLHYHLKTGGVTTVIRQQLAALKDDCRALVYSSAPPDSSFPAPVVSIPGLAYDDEQDKEADPKQVATQILDILFRKWPDGCDLLHVHNPTLAKNRSLLKILQYLADAGIRLLCQVHDFAEDGRPRAYFKDPYPADCHWAVINTRDFRILREAGLAAGGLHLLPNPVAPLAASGSTTQKTGPVLYPIRAIRRKNIGEAILLSLFFPPDAPLWITQPANSPEDQKSTADWKRFVQRLDLKVRFDAGVGADFTKLVGQSRFLLTTSITEGFGFSFLEAWTAKKLLWGRKLPDICVDFEQAGVRLDHLYSRLSVPVDWLAASGFRDRWIECLRSVCRLFSLPEDPMALKTAWEKATADGTVDFAILDESAQQTVIRGVVEDPGRRKALVGQNPFLRGPGIVEDAAERIDHNRRIVLDQFNLAIYRRRLLDAYHKVTGSAVHHSVNKAAVLSHFLAPERFSLLKWCPYGSAG